ncbi:hypothetical protein [Brevibacterium linens]|uniref:hypothetical protein n=1 Tax=Brevibacterium linens TaxID=1703 RepID=UPI003F88637A
MEGMMAGTRRTWLSVVTGVVATLIYFGTAELIARSLDVASAPALLIGQSLIPLVPTVLVKSAIAVFGTHDKLALVITIVAGGAGCGAIIGWIGARRRGLALVLLIGFGLLPAVVGVSSGAGLAATLPSLGGVAAGAAAFLFLLHLAGTADHSSAGTAAAGDEQQNRSPARPGRRAFFGLAAGLSAVGIAAVAAGHLGAGDPRRRGTRRVRTDSAGHGDLGLLPHRHSALPAVDRRGNVDAARPRHGRERVHDHHGRTPRPPSA